MYYVYNRDSGELLITSDAYPNTSLYQQNRLPYGIEELAGISVAEVDIKYNWSIPSRMFIQRNPAIRSRLEFMRRFTMQERAAIRAARILDPVVDDLMSMLEMANPTEINLEHPDTVNGIGYLVSIGCLTEARGQEILNTEV
jgi:hypothetical protein